MKISLYKASFGKHIAFILQVGAVLALCACAHVGGVDAEDQNGPSAASLESCLAEIKAWGLEMVLLPEGTFKRGKCTVGVSSFAIGATEVTQAQWKKAMGTNPSKFQGDNLPVERVTWEEAMAFCEYLNEEAGIRLPDGYRFSLPTEAQWEYACRAGTTGNHAGFCSQMAWDQTDAEHRTHSVGAKQPNDWGLYDMHGNVNEWCADWFDFVYPDAEELVDPAGPATGVWRVNRGGGWYERHIDCSSVARYYFSPDCCHDALGFRLALVPCKD